MFRKTFQKGFLTVFYANGASPLKIWDRMIANGIVKRVTDEDVRTLALEMRGSNVATCYIYTPINPKEVLGITLPFLVMIIKNLKKYFSFEVQILDDRNVRRRFRVSNYQTTTKVRPFGTTMPIGLNPGWNQIQFNLADFTKRAYGSTYVETQRIQIHANCRIRRIYFCDRLYSDEELPNEYKLFYPCVEEKVKAEEKKDDRDEVPPPSEAGEEMEEEDMEEGEGEFQEVEMPPGMDVSEVQPEEQEQQFESMAPSAPPIEEAEEKPPDEGDAEVAPEEKPAVGDAEGAEEEEEEAGGGGGGGGGGEAGGGGDEPPQPEEPPPEEAAPAD